MSFPFGQAPKTASGFTLPTTTAPTTGTTTGFQFNTGSGDNKLTTSNLFGTPTTSSTGLSFGLGQPKTTAAQALNFSSPLPQAASTAPSLTLGTPAVTAAASSAAPLQFGFGTSSTAATTTFTPILGSSTAASTGLTLDTSTPAATTTAPKLSFGLPSATSTAAAPALPLSTSTTTSTALATTTTTKTTSSIPATGSLTFAQLEDSINKWTIDLEEQGKFFINQAKQLNAWDTLLISNGEKILNLNSSIERVKQQQSQLDQELDFVLAQQKELEELIAPLEKELLDIPVTDIDRNQMYQFAEILDSQLKQMSDDLKEIIENINESHKDEEVSNPISQIGKILNAHMNSLQWIDRNTAEIGSHIEQISKIEDANRRNLSFNHSFNNSFNM